MQQQVSWLKIPIVGVPGTECQLPTTPDKKVWGDDGEPLPMEQRTSTCGAESRWMLGNVFLCQHHAAETAVLMDDSIEEIEKAWREQL